MQLHEYICHLLPLQTEKGMADIFSAAAKRRNIAPERADRIKQLLGLGPPKPEGLTRSQSTAYRPRSLSGTHDTHATTAAAQHQHTLSMVRSPSSARRCLLQLARTLGGGAEEEEEDTGVVEGQTMLMATRGRSYTCSYTFGHGHHMDTLYTVFAASARRYSTSGQTPISPSMQRTHSMQSMQSPERGRALRLASVRHAPSPGHSRHSSYNGTVEVHGNRQRYGTVNSFGQHSRGSFASSHNSRQSQANSIAGNHSSCGGSRGSEAAYPSAPQQRLFSSLGGGGDSMGGRRLSRAGAASMNADRSGAAAPLGMASAGPSAGSRVEDDLSELLVHPPRTLSIRWADHNLQRVPPLLQGDPGQPSNTSLVPLLDSSGTQGIVEMGGQINLSSRPSLPSTGSLSRGVWSMLMKKGPSGSQVAPDPAGMLLPPSGYSNGSPTALSLHPSSHTARSPHVTFTGTTAGWEIASSLQQPSGTWAQSAPSESSRPSGASQHHPATNQQNRPSRSASPVAAKAAAAKPWSLLSCLKPSGATSDSEDQDPGAGNGSRTSRLSWLQSVLGAAGKQAPAKEAHSIQGGIAAGESIPATSVPPSPHPPPGTNASAFVRRASREMGAIDEGTVAAASSSPFVSAAEPTALHLLQAKLRAEREQREASALAPVGAVPALDVTQGGRGSERASPGSRAWRGSRLMVRSQPGGEG
jgi:hypothetical protein